MLWLLPALLFFSIFGVSILIDAITSKINKRFYLEDFLFEMAMTLGMSIVIAFFSLMLSAIIFSRGETTYTRVDLISIADNQSVEGRSSSFFFIASGSIGGKMVHSFYFKEGDHAVLRQVDADKSQIFYTNDKPHVLVPNGCVPSHPLIFNMCNIDVNYPTKFYIPEGSIQNNFNLDAQ
jgi:hypothetical protein